MTDSKIKSEKIEQIDRVLSCKKAFSASPRKHYVAGDELFRIYCNGMDEKVKRKTFNRYLVDWKKESLIYSAGRGWYSDIPEEFALYNEPLVELNAFLTKTFPLLEFAFWSTRQLTSYYHNLPGKFHTFVYVDRYSMRDVANVLLKEYPEAAVLLDPDKQAIANFSPKDNNLIVRPILYDDRKFAAAPCLHIENILVDLAIESEALSLMDGAEYSAIMDNVAASGRIKPGVIVRRLTRRKVQNGYGDILRRYFQLSSPEKNQSMSTLKKR